MVGSAPDRGPGGLGSLGRDINVAVVGATGGIGSAFVEALCGSDTVAQVFALSRSEPTADGTPAEGAGRVRWVPIDIEAEESIRAAADDIRSRAASLHLVIVAIGILHDGDRLRPEKTWRALDAGLLETAFRINAVGPALVAKHFLPLLAREPKSVFAVLSARVGSIADNRLGGWHSYRASKAALNMLVRTMSIELERVNPHALCIALHPGTVDTRLSRPFRSGIPEGKLFSPAFSAGRLLTVIDGLTPEDSGNLFAWDGARIPF